MTSFWQLVAFGRNFKIGWNVTEAWKLRQMVVNLKENR